MATPIQSLLGSALILSAAACLPPLADEDRGTAAGSGTSGAASSAGAGSTTGTAASTGSTVSGAGTSAGAGSSGTSSTGAGSATSGSGDGTTGGGSTLAFSPHAVNFGPVLLATTASQTVTVTNLSNVAGTLTGSLEGNEAFGFGFQLPDVPLEPLQSASFQVTFSPSNPQAEASAILDVVGSGGQTGSLTLQGNAVTSCLHIAPVPVVFPPIPVGSLGIQALNLLNICTAPISLNSLALSDMSGPAFNLERVSVPVPGTLAGMAAVTVAIGFAPMSVGAFQAILEIFLSDTAEPMEITLSGISTGP